jgi:hypothetical protein
MSQMRQAGHAAGLAEDIELLASSDCYSHRFPLVSRRESGIGLPILQREISFSRGMTKTLVNFHQLARTAMNALATLRRHPVYKDALICQLVALLVTSQIDGFEYFVPIATPAWVLYWVGLAFYVKFRGAPTRSELFLARVGPLFIFVVVFVIGQYL